MKANPGFKEEIGKFPKVSLILPVCNEEMNIDPFYHELSGILGEMPDLEWEIIFVDDGSGDSSAEKISALRTKDARVKMLRLSRNFGSHAALSAGLSYAAGDAAVVMSVDLQDPPAILKDLIAEWRKGSHVVWGIRQFRNDPWGKKFLARAFYWFCRKIALADYPEAGMDTGLFDRRVIEEYLRIQDRQGFVFALILWMGFRQTQVFYKRSLRRAGVSKWSFAKRLKSAVDIIVSFSYFPIRLASYLGLAISLVSFLYAVELIIEKVLFGRGGSGWPSLMVTILFLGGIQLIMIGILGEYLWRGTDQVKGRPRFIVMEEVGFEKKQETETSRPPFLSGR